MAVYSKGKRAKNRQPSKRNKIIIIGILICIIIIAVIYLIFRDSLLGLDNKPDEDTIIGNITYDEQQDIQNVEQKKDEIVSDVTIPEKIGDYKVWGKLVIPKINVDSNILASYSDEALELSIR